MVLNTQSGGNYIPPSPALNAPVLLLPQDNSSSASIRPQFQWNIVNGALNYQLQISTSSNFNIVNFNIVTTAASDSSSLLQYNTQYFWRVKAMNNVDTSFWSSIWSFTTLNILPPPSSWAFDDSTGNNATIIVPATINPVIGSRNIALGDAIGVFYDRNNQLICAGYEIWNGQNIGITVWGDNDQTTIKDGFNTGDNYTFKLWDAQTGTEYTAAATYLAGMFYTDHYEENGISVLTSLSSAFQQINLPVGWSMISSYILPSDPSLDVLCAGISNDLVVMKNGSGDLYIPSYGINTIGNWDIHHGYQMFMTGAEILLITGSLVEPQTTPLTLPTGWSLISYLRNSPMSVLIALNPITNDILVVKNGGGQLYIPSYGINTIGNMVPGEGYQIYMMNPGTLLYPANTSPRVIINPSEMTPMPMRLISAIKNTGNSATLILNCSTIEDGSEIGVYNVHNELVGSGTVQNGTAGSSIWGDNPMTEEIDGAMENETLHARVLNAIDNTEQDLNLSEVFNYLTGKKSGYLFYAMDAVYIANSDMSIEDGLNLMAAPNPTTGKTTLSYTLQQECQVDITITNSLGMKVAAINNSETQTAGNHHLTFDYGEMPSGMYYIMVSACGRTESKSVLLIK